MQNMQLQICVLPPVNQPQNKVSLTHNTVIISTHWSFIKTRIAAFNGELNCNSLVLFFMSIQLSNHLWTVMCIQLERFLYLCFYLTFSYWFEVGGSTQENVMSHIRWRHEQRSANVIFPSQLRWNYTHLRVTKMYCQTKAQLLAASLLLRVVLLALTRCPVKRHSSSSSVALNTTSATKHIGTQPYIIPHPSGSAWNFLLICRQRTTGLLLANKQGSPRVWPPPCAVSSQSSLICWRKSAGLLPVHTAYTAVTQSWLKNSLLSIHTPFPSYCGCHILWMQTFSGWTAPPKPSLDQQTVRGKWGEGDMGYIHGLSS